MQLHIHSSAALVSYNQVPMCNCEVRKLKPRKTMSPFLAFLILCGYTSTYVRFGIYHSYEVMRFFLVVGHYAIILFNFNFYYIILLQLSRVCAVCRRGLIIYTLSIFNNLVVRVVPAHRFFILFL